MTRLPSLTSLRWFAALLVFVQHAIVLLDGTALAGPLRRYTSLGSIGVCFFFVLSGFVLTWSDRGVGAREFYRRRVARILPAYWVAAVIGIAFEVASHNGSLLRGLFTLSLLQSWIPRILEWNYAGNAVGWSLSTEVLFYALFPLLIGPIARMGRRGAGALLVVSLAVAILWPALVHPVSFPSTRFWAIDIAPPARLPEFVAGAALARLLSSGVRLGIPLWAPMALLGGLLVLGNRPPEWTGPVALAVIPCCLLIFAAGEADLEGRPTGLRHGALIRLGQWSYAFYLVHQLVTRSFAASLDAHAGTPARVAAVVGSFALALLAAYLLFTLVERPLERRIRRGSSSVRPAEPAPAIAPG